MKKILCLLVTVIVFTLIVSADNKEIKFSVVDNYPVISYESLDVITDPYWREQFAFEPKTYTLRGDLSKYKTNIKTNEDASSFYSDTYNIYTRYVLIDEEIILVQQGTSSGFLNVKRGQLGTNCAEHKDGAVIKQFLGWRDGFRPIPYSSLYNEIKTDRVYNPGDEVVFAVIVEGNYKLKSVEFEISNPECMKLVSTKKGEAFSKLKGTTLSGDKVKYEDQVVTTSNGIVMFLTFKINDDAWKETEYVKVKIIDALDTQGENVHFDDMNISVDINLGHTVETPNVGKEGAPIVREEGEIVVILDANQVMFDVKPTIINGTTLVPVRAIFEALGASVNWDDATRTVLSTKGATSIKLPVDSKTMYVNGASVTLNYPAVIIGGRTLVPVRAISEAYGCLVGWDGYNKQVSVIADTGVYSMLYTLDGRAKSFKRSEVAKQLTVGWYEEPVQTLYAPGKSKVFKKSEVAAQLSVGWYEYPVQTLYAPGKSKVFKKSEVPAQLKAGWYEEPVVRLYAKGKSKVFKETEARAQLAVGWYWDEALTDNDPRYTDEELYTLFVDFAKKYGEYEDNQYSAYWIDSIEDDDSSLITKISLIYDTKEKELIVEYIDLFTDEDTDVSLMETLEIHIPKIRSSYNWEYSKFFNYPSYSRYEDSLGIAEGTVNTVSDSYPKRSNIKLTGTKYDSITDPLGDVADIFKYLATDGDELFEKYDSALRLSDLNLK